MFHYACIYDINCLPPPAICTYNFFVLIQDPEKREEELLKWMEEMEEPEKLLFDFCGDNPNNNVGGKLPCTLSLRHLLFGYSDVLCFDFLPVCVCITYSCKF